MGVTQLSSDWQQQSKQPDIDDNVGKVGRNDKTKNVSEMLSLLKCEVKKNLAGCICTYICGHTTRINQHKQGKT